MEKGCAGSGIEYYEINLIHRYFYLELTSTIYQSANRRSFSDFLKRSLAIIFLLEISNLSADFFFRHERAAESACACGSHLSTYLRVALLEEESFNFGHNRAEFFQAFGV